MERRAQMGEPERSMRSRLSKLFYDQDVIVGSLVTMRRVCGKPTCHCARGEKHESTYLAYCRGGKRRMLIVPQAQLAHVRTAVEQYRRAKALLQKLSGLCQARLMPSKAR